MTKRLALFSAVVLFSGCASIQNGKMLPKNPPEGTKFTVPADGSWFWGPRLTIHNLAKKGVMVVPESGGKLYPASYKLGSRSAWCLGLCRKKIATGYFGIGSGGSLTVPLVETTDGYYDRRMSLTLYVYENNRLIGRYFYCIVNPLYHTAVQNAVFDQDTLESMKAGRYGEMCQRARQYW